jgi:hypothetical protein
LSLEHAGPDPDVTLVPVFDIKDGAVLPLAEFALEGAGIEYSVRAHNMIIPGVGEGTNRTGFDGAVPGQIFVRSDDAARARELLADLESPAPIAAANEPTETEWDQPARTSSADDSE